MGDFPLLIRNGLITFILLIGSLSVHEWAHAITADRLGDDTPRNQGRVTLNPLVHMDLWGTVIIPLFTIFVLQGVFSLIGWGRPVMTTPANFKRRRLDESLVSLAGPAANLGIALLCVFAGAFLVPRDPRLAELFTRCLVMNVALAVFNLLPLPPLDGGTVLRHAVGMTEATYMAISRWTGIILLVAINIAAVRGFFGFLIALACTPYFYLCHAINPEAAQMIFSFGG